MNKKAGCCKGGVKRGGGRVTLKTEGEPSSRPMKKKGRKSAARKKAYA